MANGEWRMVNSEDLASLPFAIRHSPFAAAWGTQWRK
jgi:hypothetical protein